MKMVKFSELKIGDTFKIKRNSAGIYTKIKEEIVEGDWWGQWGMAVNTIDEFGDLCPWDVDNFVLVDSISTKLL
jgi:hypothetical protein